MSALRDAAALARSRATGRGMPFAIPTAEEMAASNAYYARLNAMPLSQEDRCEIQVSREIAGQSTCELDQRADADAAEDRAFDEMKEHV